MVPLVYISVCVCVCVCVCVWPFINYSTLLEILQSYHEDFQVCPLPENQNCQEILIAANQSIPQRIPEILNKDKHHQLYH